MPTFEQGDLVRVPFPYLDRNRRQHRPALVVSAGAIGSAATLLWVAMITSARNPPWPDDIVIADHAAAGLPVPSVIRPAKLATIEMSRADPIGRAAPATTAAVIAYIQAALGRPRA